MVIDSRAFRQTVSQFVTGVTVVATEVDGEIRAMTVNAFIGRTVRLSVVVTLISTSGFYTDQQ